MDTLNNKCDQQQMTVTTSATVLPDIRAAAQLLGFKNPERVIVQALSDNTNSIFIKNANDVADDGSTGGTEVPPGGNIELPLAGGYYKNYFAITSGTEKLQITYLAGN